MSAKNKNYRVALVIGNGFDLDLGLKTSYKNFMDSSYFRAPDNITSDDCFERTGVNLFDYLKEKGKDKDNWIDLEKELADFAMLQSSEKMKATPLEEKTFFVLQENLCRYIKDLAYDVNKDSNAIQLLKILIKYPVLDILSFNYTDLKKLEQFVGKIETPIEYVHGNILDNSIILGFQDSLDVNESFCFMIKAFNPCYKSHNVREKLLDADEVIFFGHSLGDVDYHYFEDLFMQQSQSEKARKIILRIFTYDESARMKILFQLRAMNNKRTDLLYDLCDFEIYRTNGLDCYKIKKYFEELFVRLKEMDYKSINNAVKRINIL